MLKSTLFNGVALVLIGLIVGCEEKLTCPDDSNDLGGFSVNLLGVDDLQIESATKDSMRKGADYLQLLIKLGPSVDIRVNWYNGRSSENPSAFASVNLNSIEYENDFAIKGVVDFWGEAMKGKTAKDVKKILIHEILHVIAFNPKILHCIGLMEKDKKYWLENKNVGEFYLHLHHRIDLIDQQLYYVPMDPEGVHWAEDTQLWDIMDPTYSGGIASGSTGKLLEEVGYEVELPYSQVPDQSKIESSRNYCRANEDSCFYTNTMPNN